MASSGHAAMLRALPEVWPRFVDLREGAEDLQLIAICRCYHASPEEKKTI